MKWRPRIGLCRCWRRRLCRHAQRAVGPIPHWKPGARAISQELRCVVCQNQTIDDSDADLAHDLRVLLRQRLKAGDTDQQAVAFLVNRYGA